MSRVRVRGVYTTAVTALLREADIAVTDPSPPIRERFGEEFADAAPAAVVHSSRDRLGLECSGDATPIEETVSTIAGVAIDAIRTTDRVPREAAYVGTVVETPGSGAIVDLGVDGEGYLPYDAVEGYVDEGDRYRLQVREPTPPWSDHRPRLEPGLRVETPLLGLERGGDGVTVEANASTDDEVTELVRLTELLETAPPDGWSLTWHRGAIGASMDRLESELAHAAERARTLEDGVPREAAALADSPDGRLAAPLTTEWVRFGGDARRRLDHVRRRVTTTVPGHHRLKVVSEGAGDVVDFFEAFLEVGDSPLGGWATVRAAGTSDSRTEPAGDPATEPSNDREADGDCNRGTDHGADGECNRGTDYGADGAPNRGSDRDDPAGRSGARTAASSPSGSRTEASDSPEGEPTDAILGAAWRTFGPDSGDDLDIEHGKPAARSIQLGPATVRQLDVTTLRLTVERELSGGGTYDALGTPIEAGDVAETRFTEGRWWYPTTYRDRSGATKGTYVNVCTPVEVFPDAVRYVDLYVDVIKHPDGLVEIVDEGELEVAVEAGHVSPELADRARTVARSVRSVLE